jgi:hypothetical protein
MPPELILWLVVGFLALVVLHEATHAIVARVHGHPLVCVAVNPIGVCVVFEDAPRPRYWLAQVILPAVVSWIVCYVWLYGVFTFPAPYQAKFDLQKAIDALPLIVTLLTLLTSGGDIFSGWVELRKPLWGDARIHRDFGTLKKIPSWVYFTAHGRRKWQPVWVELKAQAPAPAPSAS